MKIILYAYVKIKEMQRFRNVSRIKLRGDVTLLLSQLSVGLKF
jgi:hypothetical protein